jgi:hypothetical protein
MRQAIPESKNLANGGLIRKYANAGKVELTEIEQETLDKFDSKSGYQYHLVEGRPLSYRSANFENVDVTKTGPKTIIGRASRDLRIAPSIIQKVARVIQLRKQQKAQLSEEEKAAQLAQEKLEKDSAIASKRVLNFGLVGLRYGTSKKDAKDSLTNFSYGIPPGLQDDTYNITKARENSDAFIRIKTATISEKLGPKSAENIQKKILDDFKLSVSNAADQIYGGKTNTSPSLLEDAVNNAEFYNVIGSALEAAIGVMGAPIIPKTEDTKGIDFPDGLGSVASIFGAQFKNIPTDVTRTIGGEGKSAASYRGQIIRWLTNSKPGEDYLKQNFPNIKKFANGGLSAQTVPAMVSNDEGFVPPQLAQRIGYANLDRINQADRNGMGKYSAGGISKFKGPGSGTSDSIGPIGLPVGSYVIRANAMEAMGLNKGGIVGSNVRSFAAGGSIDPVIAIGAVVSVLTQELGKVANTFKNLDGTFKDFGAVVGDVIQSVTSQLTSTTIALKAIGVSGKALAATQIGGSIGAATGSLVTTTSTQALDKILLESNKQLGEFNKNLKDVNEAATDELRIAAATRLEQSFFALDKTVRNNAEAMVSAEFYQKLGTSINSVNSGILATVTAMSSLRLATVRQTRLVNSGGFARVAREIGVFGAALGVVGKFAGWIGIAITVIQVAVEAFSLFTSKSKNSAEQLDRLNDALQKTVENSNDFNLANQQFTNETLQIFRELQARARAPGPQGYGERIRQAVQEDERLDLRYRTQVKSLGEQFGVVIQDGELVQKYIDRINDDLGSGTKRSAEFAAALQELKQNRNLADLRSYLRETEGLSGEDLDKRITALGGPQSPRSIRLAEKYRSELNLQMLSAKELAESTSRLSVSFLRLNNILDTTLKTYEFSLGKLNATIAELNISAGPPVIDTSGLLDRTINTFQNLSVASASETAQAISRVTSLTNLPEEQSQEFRQRIIAGQVLQQQGPLLLEQLRRPGQSTDISSSVREFLAPQLRAALPQGTSAETAINSVVNEVAANLQKIVEKGGGDLPKVLEDLGKDSKGLSELLGASNDAIKFAIKSSETFQKSLQALAQEQKKVLDLELQIKQSTIDRLQREQQDNIRLQEAFDIKVPLETRLKVFDTSILELTKGLDGLDDIFERRQKRISLAQDFFQSDTGFTAAMTQLATQRISTSSPIGPKGTTNVQDIIAARSVIKEQIDSLSKSADLSSEENERRQNLIGEYDSLTEALKKIADSGEAVNAVFDSIAKQRDLFKTRTEKLLDLIEGFRDPVKAGDLLREFSVINRFLDPAQRNQINAQELLGIRRNPFIGLLNPEAQARIPAQIAQILVSQLQGTNNPELKSALDNISRYLETEGGTKNIVTKYLQRIFGDRKAAASELQEDRLSELQKRQNGIILAYSDFTTQFKGAGSNAVKAVEDFTNEFNAKRLATPQVNNQIGQQVSAGLSRYLRVFNSDNIDVSTLGVSLKELQNFSGQNNRATASDFETSLKRLRDIGVVLRSKDDTNRYVSGAEANTAYEGRGKMPTNAYFLPLEQIIGKEAIDEAFVQAQKQLKVGDYTSPEAAQKTLDGVFDTLLSTLTKSAQQNVSKYRGFFSTDGLFPSVSKPSRDIAGKVVADAVRESLRPVLDSMKKQIFPTAPQNNQNNRTNTLDGASIQRFSDSATQLATAISGQNITDLTQAVNSLGPATADLKEAVSKLSSLFKDGKMRIEQNSTAQVDVNFGNPVSVDANNLQNNLIGEIGSIVRDNIRQKMNEMLYGG